MPETLDTLPGTEPTLEALPGDRRPGVGAEPRPPQACPVLFLTSDSGSRSWEVSSKRSCRRLPGKQTNGPWRTEATSLSQAASASPSLCP